MSEFNKNENDTMDPIAILNSEEIQESELDKLKGDTIGETVYSGKWIANTLLSLSKVHQEGWNKKLEDDLCTLWDMTTEKDIMQFLVENDFFKVADFSLKSNEEPRLMEIILGIIGNLSCELEILEQLGTTEDLVDTILRHLSSEDAATLMQILRILRSALWNIQNDSESVWRDNLRSSTYLREVIPFILKSSTNEELLILTTNFLRSTAEIDLPSGTALLEELFESSSLLPGLLESFEEVLPQEEAQQYSNTILKYLEDWLELFSNLRKDHQVLQNIIQKDILRRTIDIPLRILTNFADPWNLFPLDETKASCVHRCAETILDFRLKGFLQEDTTIDIDQAILKIIYSISAATKEKEEDLEETMEELLKYLEGYWTEISKISSSKEIVKILKTSEKEAVEHALNLLKTKIPEEKLNSIIETLSDD